MIELNKFYIGESVQFMKENLPDDFVDLTVTSPPYDNLRTYKGFIFDYQSMLKELYRITKSGGIVVWVVGDATIKGSETGTSFRHALYAKEIGFNLHDTMIYHKINPIPIKQNRYYPCFEYMFILSKGKPNTFNPLMQPCKTAGASYNYATRSSATTKEQSSAMRKRNQLMFTKAEKYRGNIWGYDTGKNKGSKDDIWEHPATFPEKLANDHILSWYNENDLVFDPMMGSGTTGKMAILNNRNFIGIEKVEEYYKIAQERIKETQDNKQKSLF